MHYQLILSYDGTDFLGWQSTKMGPSIQESIKKCLEKLLQSPIQLEGASRTDKGVHAYAQVACFHTEHILDCANFSYRLNRLLPSSIKIRSLTQVSTTFHPSLDAYSKIYQYNVVNKDFISPFDRSYYWHVSKLINKEKMDFAKDIFLGRQDFAYFCNESPSKPENTTCEVLSIDISYDLNQQIYRFTIEGTRFLYKMVRNLVGTLIQVGQNQLSIEGVQEAMEKKDRRLLGMTAPAHGLFLKQVKYKKDIYT